MSYFSQSVIHNLICNKLIVGHYTEGKIWVLKIFSRRGSDLNFPIKKEGLVKYEAYSKSEVSLNNLSKVITLCLCVVFVLCSFIAFQLVFFVPHRKNFVLLDEIRRCMTSASEYFLKRKENVDFNKVTFRFSKILIQCLTG